VSTKILGTKIRGSRFGMRLHRVAPLGLALGLIWLGAAAPAGAGGMTQEAFPNAQQAFDSFVAAERIDEKRELLHMLGVAGGKLIYSGDPVADREHRQRFVAAYDQGHRVDAAAADKAFLVVGTDPWTFPIPVVRQGDAWRFDTAAGLQKILSRRIGRNELDVMQVCRAYVIAQREFAARSHPGGAAPEYARKFRSSAGAHDGLYWEARPGEDESPLGPLVASARAEGYGGDRRNGPHHPYHGYFFRILERQGRNAPGGAREYVVNGHMTAGFGLLAFPAKWGDSGVMTFMVDQHGIVFEKNLGAGTATLARHITAFDPDRSWRTP
jgi:hypothetical protein